MTARTQFGGAIKTFAFAVEPITDAATEAFATIDAGGSNNALYLPGATGFKSTDRVMVLFTSTRVAGTTNIITFVVEDADGTSTTIGTPAAATVSGDSLVAGTADAKVLVGVLLKQDRPWLKLSVTSSAATDDVVCTATVLGIPAGL